MTRFAKLFGGGILLVTTCCLLSCPFLWNGHPESVATMNGNLLQFNDWQQWPPSQGRGCQEGVYSMTFTFKRKDSIETYAIPRLDTGRVALTLWAMRVKSDNAVAVVNDVTAEIAILGENTRFLQRGYVKDGVVYLFEVGECCDAFMLTAKDADGHVEAWLCGMPATHRVPVREFFADAVQFGRIGRDARVGKKGKKGEGKKGDAAEWHCRLL